MWTNKWCHHSTFTVCLVSARYYIRNYENEIEGDGFFIYLFSFLFLLRSSYPNEGDECNKNIVMDILR